MATVPPATATTREPKDEGLFGPKSVSWMVMGAPAAGVGAGAAAVLQMLVPRLMWMIDQASSFRQHPEDRGHQTSMWGLTTTYGDTESAERAGELLQLIHRGKTAIDQATGEEYRADEQDLLVWVHNTIVWCILRACDRWGPVLSPAQKERFVQEQRVAARLVGIDPPEQAAGSVSELEGYIAGMESKLGFTEAGIWFRDMAIPRFPSLSKKGMMGWVISRMIVSLWTPGQQQVYGVRGSLMTSLASLIGGKLLSAAAAKMPPDEDFSTRRREAVNTDWANYQPGPPKAAPPPGSARANAAG